MKSDGTVLIFGAVIITVILKCLAGCETTPDPRDEIRPPFEPCEVKVIDEHGEHCKSWQSVCRDLVNCG
ncbi:MAG: hypothetical protein LLG14_27345 [Nocardiaceae bacterium]|nr:hypothetical protein [Nocardiaceae bacterium]